MSIVREQERGEDVQYARRNVLHIRLHRVAKHSSGTGARAPGESCTVHLEEMRPAAIAHLVRHRHSGLFDALMGKEVSPCVSHSCGHETG